MKEYISFKKVIKDNQIEIITHTEMTWPELADMFQDFLLASGYGIPRNISFGEALQMAVNEVECNHDED